MSVSLRVKSQQSFRGFVLGVLLRRFGSRGSVLEAWSYRVYSGGLFFEVWF